MPAAALSNSAAAGVQFPRRNCPTPPPRGVKRRRHIHPLLLTDEQVHAILKIAFHPKEVGDRIKRFIDENERKLDEEEHDEKTREN